MSAEDDLFTETAAAHGSSTPVPGSETPAGVLAAAMAALKEEPPCIQEAVADQLKRLRNIVARNKHRLSGDLAGIIFMAELAIQWEKRLGAESQNIILARTPKQ